MNRIETKLTKEQLALIGARIIDRVYNKLSGGTKFGVDWPTFRTLFPREAAVFRRLRIEYQNRKEVKNG